MGALWFLTGWAEGTEFSLSRLRQWFSRISMDPVRTSAHCRFLQPSRTIVHLRSCRLCPGARRRLTPSGMTSPSIELSIALPSGHMHRILRLSSPPRSFVRELLLRRLPTLGSGINRAVVLTGSRHIGTTTIFFTDGLFGVQVHHPQFLEWVGTPESAGLLGRALGEWLRSLTRVQTPRRCAPATVRCELDDVQSQCSGSVCSQPTLCGVGYASIDCQ